MGRLGAREDEERHYLVAMTGWIMSTACEQKTLWVAARFANYTNFGATWDEFRRKSEVLAHHCRETGRDYAEIVRSSLFNVLIGATEARVAERIA